MAKERFSKQQAFGFGWATWKKNIGFMIALLCVAFLVQMAPAFISAYLKKEAPFLSALVNIFYHAAAIIISMGFIRVCLAFCDGKKPEIADLFKSYPLFFSFLLGSIFYGLIVLGGVILLIIPGIIWGIQFQFFTYFMVDRKAGPVEALKKSSRLTRGVKFDLFIFNIMVLGINLLGVCALFIGLFITIPVTMLATAYVYRALLEAQARQPAVETLAH